MSVEIRSHATKGSPRERGKVLWLTGFWLVSVAIWGPSVQAEVLYEKDGVQLRGTARIVTENAATCQVLEESHTEASYEELKANDGQPLHVWRLDYSVHNGTGKTLSYLRADFDIESEYPPCTNWTGEGPGGGPTGGPYSSDVFWGDHLKTLSAPYGMAPDQVMQEVLHLVVFHTEKPSFERWSTHFTFGEPDKSVRPTAGQLPPEMRLDEYLMEAEMLSEEKDHKGALEALGRIVALQKEHNLKLPEEFPFRYAQAAMAAGSYQAAIDSVNRYLSVVGREGKHYREALAVRVKSRRALRAPAGTVVPDAVRRERATPSAAEGVAAREKTAAEARPAWESICDGSEESPSCWKELESHPGCYVWNPNVPEARSVTWTGNCVDWRAEGSGRLHWEGGSEWCCGHAESTGLLRGGKHTGQWIVRYDDPTGKRPFHSVAEGSFQNGERHGPWVFRHYDGSRSEGGYVDGLRHGRWNEYGSSGRLFAWTDYERGVNQFGKNK